MAGGRNPARHEASTGVPVGQSLVGSAEHVDEGQPGERLSEIGNCIVRSPVDSAIAVRNEQPRTFGSELGVQRSVRIGEQSGQAILTTGARRAPSGARRDRAPDGSAARTRTRRR